jgi:hypothetical protein
MKVLPIEEALKIVKAARKKIHDLPRRSLTDCIASKLAIISLASCLTEPMAVASSSSITLDDIPSLVAAPLPYNDSGVLAKDVPMDESMEVLDLNQAPELEEVEMLDISCSPHWCKDWEDYNELMNELDLSWYVPYGYLQREGVMTWLSKKASNGKCTKVCPHGPAQAHRYSIVPLGN